jgi:hypothetical protein
VADMPSGLSLTPPQEKTKAWEQLHPFMNIRTLLVTEADVSATLISVFMIERHSHTVSSL